MGNQQNKPTDRAPEKFEYKILLIGERRVGKTWIITQFTNVIVNEFEF